MIVKIPRLSGFCPGVKNAEKKIFKALSDRPEEKHSVLGMMINNRRYIEYLEQHGVKTVGSIDEFERSTTVYIRTHGLDRKLQEALEEDFTITDLTCINVKRVQEIINEHSNKGAAVIITGKKSHPEVAGLKSYGEQVMVIETYEELDDFIKNEKFNGAGFEPEKYTEIFITSQTTGSRLLFESAKAKISQKWKNKRIESFNSICPVTERKEIEALALQKETEISFVIGDPLSSNANKLFNRLKQENPDTWFIQDADDLDKLDIDINRYSSALVVSSASTPQFVEEEVVKRLETV
ncbi:MAG: 4-hydroxy-3-methylbut-2-enyl diphosphate reductase [Spirochaetales bacterium]|uniref:4-hydroxy-3-methylbut-2-enyl diphosphate reductase n=1 Tax=Candidatus Thalassospirochaeta sargassi TaxID=3119039 RepID=A0AAJ1IGD0_9SPIO|nr:4-hydroxy-3-methylbut-2-enyl diphosphate reductase [Spirochaetales bacterium]